MAWSVLSPVQLRLLTQRQLLSWVFSCDPLTFYHRCFCLKYLYLFSFACFWALCKWNNGRRIYLYTSVFSFTFILRFNSILCTSVVFHSIIWIQHILTSLVCYWWTFRSSCLLLQTVPWTFLYMSPGVRAKGSVWDASRNTISGL